MSEILDTGTTDDYPKHLPNNYLTQQRMPMAASESSQSQLQTLE